MPQAIIGLALVIGSLTGVGIAVPTWVLIGMLEVGSSMVLSGIGKKLSKPHNLGSPQTVNIRQADSPRLVRYGRCYGTGGVLTFVQLVQGGYGLTLVYTLSGHEISSIDGLNFDGAAITYGAPDAHGARMFTGKYAGRGGLEFKLGAPGEPAFYYLIENGAGLWTSNHRQDGCCSVKVHLFYDTTIYPNGVPGITFNLKGKKVYDPRTSSTAYSENPALILRDYLTDTDYGLGVDAADINDASVIVAANICDEQVQKKDLSYEPRYTCNGSFDYTVAPQDVIKGILSSMAGYAVYTSGQWHLLAGAWRAPTVHLSTDDLTGPIQYQVKRSRRELCNSVRGTYVSPDNKWKSSDYPPLIHSTYVVEDGGTNLWESFDLPFTVSSSMAQRIANIYVERNRRQGTLTLDCKLNAYQLQPGDVFWFSHSRFGWTDKTFEVLEMQLTMKKDSGDAPVLGVQIKAQETDAAMFDWDPANEGDIVIPEEPDIEVSVPAIQYSLLPAVARGAFTGTNPLSQDGTTKTILVAASTIQWGSTQVNYSSGSVTPSTYGLKYVYCDDSMFAGGAVTYVATINALDLNSNDTRIPFGQITTAIGGGGTGGGGLPDTCFTPNTQVKTQRGNVRFSDIKDGDMALTARGTWRRILRVTSSEFSGAMMDMGEHELSTPGHHFLNHGAWKRLDEVAKLPLVPYHGSIANLLIEAEDDGKGSDTEHSYTLANGHLVHNIMDTR